MEKSHLKRPLVVKYTALVLAVLLLVPLLLPSSMRAGEIIGGKEPDAFCPVICYGGVSIEDGMELSEDALLSIKYEFETTYEELSVMTVVLPEPLLAATPGSYTVTAADSSGNEKYAGEAITGEDGLISFDVLRDSGENDDFLQISPPFEDLAYEPEDEVLPDLQEEDMPEQEETGEAEEFTEPFNSTFNSAENILTSEPGELDGEEPFRALFEIPVMFDLGKIPPAEDGVRQISLQSGGAAVIVYISSEITPLQEPDIMHFAVGVPLEDLAAILGAFLYSGSTELTSGAAVSYDDTLSLKYEFAVDYLSCSDIWNSIKAGVKPEYVIPLPVGLAWKQTGVIVLSLSDEGVQKEFAELRVEGGVAYLKFTGEFWNSIYPPEIDAGWLQLECVLDKNVILNSMPSFDLELYGGKVITILVPENKKSEHLLVKSGNYQDNRFTWTVSYVPGEEAAVYPLTILDEFDNSKHIFVPGSLVINGFSYSDDIVLTEGSLTSIAYMVNEAEKNNPVILTYQTRLADSQITETSTSALNTAYLLDDNGAQVVSPAAKSVTVTADQKRWMSKNGVQNDRNIDWTITVSSLDRDLIDLVLYDAISDGLTLLPESIRVNGKTLAEAGAELIYPSGVVNDGNIATFAIKFNVSPYPSLYTIRYTTVVDNGYFDNPKLTPDFGNNAWLTFGWRKYNADGTNGTGSYVSHTPPSVGKGLTAVTNVIKKTSEGYDPSTHKITWKITVNPYHVDLYSGTVTDVLLDYGQAYVQGSFKSGSGLITLTSAANDTLTVGVGLLGKSESWFTFETLVNDPEAYAANHSGVKYTNTASFAGFLTEDDGPGPVITDKSSAEITVTSQMLEKQAGGYSYNSTGGLEITWVLIVNQNKMPMAGAEIKDTLPKGLSYVPDSLKINGADAQDPAPAIGQTLTILLGGAISDTVTIEYRTLVNPNDTSLSGSFLDDNIVELKNIAALTHDEYMIEVSDFAIQEISNQILDKKGKFDEDDKVIKYTVNINPNGVMLNAQKIEDILPAGLRLDIESVELSEAEIKSNGSFAAKPGGSVYEYDSPIFLYGENSFILSLPSGSKRYILSYDCYIASGVSFDNQIKFTTGDVGEDPGSTTGNVNVGSGGGGTSSKKARLVITKQDAKRSGVKLEDVKFDVFLKVGSSEILVMTVATGKDGKADIYPLSQGKDYVIRETGISGYLDAGIIDTDEHVIAGVSDAEDGVLTVKVTETGEHTLTVTNEPVLGSFSFIKTSDKADKGIFRPWTDTLDSAGFTIYDQTEGSSLQIGQNANNAAGKVEFTNVPFGIYKVVETKTPEYHTKANDFYVEINSGGVTVTTGFGNGTATVGNVYFRPSLIVAKTSAAGSSTPLAGVEFELYEAGIPAYIEKLATDTNGKVTFNNLYGGKSYIIKETGNPRPGFYKTGDYSINTVNQAEDYNLEWKNYPHSASIKITKVDSMRTGVTLAGAVFELYPTKADALAGSNLIGAITSGADGVVTFSGLALNQDTSALTIDGTPGINETSFWLVEKTAPVGYDLDPTPFEITFPDGSAYNAAEIVQAENTPTEAQGTSLTFYKLSDKFGLDMPLAGIAFKLHDTTPGSTLVLGPVISETDGKVEFTNIPFGKYWIEEVTTPAYHKKIAANTVFVEFNASGACVAFNGVSNPVTKADFTVYNEVFKPNLVITKIDFASKGTISGVWFDLYNENDLDTAVDSQQTNASGKVTFTLIGGERYVVKERSAPEGYYLSANYSTGIINLETLLPITWNNYPYAASIKITKRDAAAGRTNILLDGAEYNLYRGSVSAANLVGSAATVNGILTFSKLPLTQTGVGWNTEPTLINTEYFLVETKAPDGYILNSNPVSVILTSRTHAYTQDLSNAPVTGDLIFDKISDKFDLGAPLEGIEFNLHDTTPGSTLVLGPVASGTNGRVEFTNIPFGKYWVEEVAAPAYHKKITDQTVYIEISKTGECVEFNGVQSPVGSDFKITNEVFKPELEITKINSDSSTQISGIWFDLYNENDLVTVIASRQTDFSGKAKFTLIGGEKYIVKERNTQEGYYVSADYHTGTVNLDTLTPITWKNYPYAASIIITKRDMAAGRTGILLDGAEYNLYRGSVSEANLVDSGITSGGILTFGGLSLTQTGATWNTEPTLANTEYFLVETKAPDGYVLDSAPVSVVLTSRTHGYPLGIDNAPVTGNLTFTKISRADGRTDRPLSGAEFTLTDQTAGSTYSVKATSDENGAVSFTGIPFGRYLVEETGVPQYHSKYRNFYMEIDENGSCVEFDGETDVSKLNALTVINVQNLADLKIKKVDETNAAVQGVEFTLYRWVEGIWQKDGASQATGNSGEVSMILIVGEKYKISEATPDGYYAVPDYEFTAEEGGHNFTWVNGRISGEIVITKKDAVTGDLLEGVRFGLYAGGTPATFLKDAYTDDSGEAVFDGLPLDYTYRMNNGRYEILYSGKTYIVRELDTLSGYMMDSSDEVFNMNEVGQQLSSVLTNERSTADITFTKINEWDILLGGAEFTLIGNFGGGVTEKSVTSNQNGTVKFENVPFGTYTLTEKTAPADHKLNVSPYTIEVNKSGAVTFPPEMTGGKFVNEFKSGSISIHKINGDTSEPISGVAFTIYDSSGIPRGTAVTDAGGIAEFAKLMINENYILKETAPSGFYPSVPLDVLALSEGEERAITWNNYPCEGSITVTVVDSKTGQTLSGVKFGLYSKDGTLLAEATSDKNGKLVFTGLPLQTLTEAAFDTPPDIGGDIEYIIKELSNIPGYEPMSGTISVTLSDVKPDSDELAPKSKIPDPPPSIGDQDDNSGGRGGRGGSGDSGISGGSTGGATITDTSTEAVPDNVMSGMETDPADLGISGENGANDEGLIENGDNIGEGGEDGGTDINDAPERNTEIKEPENIPDLAEVPETNILHPSQLPEGYSMVRVEDNIYIIYDEKGNTLGYIYIPEGVLLDEVDIMEQMLPFTKNNPKTGEYFGPGVLQYGAIVLVLDLVTMSCFAARRRARGKVICARSGKKPTAIQRQTGNG